jgi:hypothetical protein
LTITRTGELDITGSTMWTFEPTPQSGGVIFRTTIESQNAWLPFTATSTSGLTPSPNPPTQINTHGTYASPRGCRGDFGSGGEVQARTIDASFFGVDCPQPFEGRARLTKQ